MPTATYREFRGVLQRAGFQLVRRRKHETWEKTLPTGEILQVRISHQVGRDIPTHLFHLMTHPEMRVYALQGDTLVQAVASDLVGIGWGWEGFLGGDDSRLVVDHPGKYTIEFGPAGSVAIRADCNTGRAPYRVSGPRLEIGPILMTRAVCPPGSLGDWFARYLADTVAYLLRDGHLILDVKLDSGQMRFSPARP